MGKKNASKTAIQKAKAWDALMKLLQHPRSEGCVRLNAVLDSVTVSASPLRSVVSNTPADAIQQLLHMLNNE